MPLKTGISLSAYSFFGISPFQKHINYLNISYGISTILQHSKIAKYFEAKIFTGHEMSVDYDVVQVSCECDFIWFRCHVNVIVHGTHSMCFSTVSHRPVSWSTSQTSSILTWRQNSRPLMVRLAFV